MAVGAVSEYILGWNVAATVCLIVGVLLLVWEMFTPGLNAPGILGLVSLAAAVILRADSFKNALITLALILIFVGVAAYVVFRSLSRGRLSKSWMVLHDSDEGKSTSLAGEEKQALIGREGVCLNTLRPSGNADFDGEKLDVMSAGEFIEKGSRVRIVKVEGLRITVTKI